MKNIKSFTLEQQVAYITNQFAPAIQDLIDNDKRYELLATLHYNQIIFYRQKLGNYY